MSDGRHSAPRGRSNKDEEAKKAALANEQRLIALGDAVAQRSGVPGKKHRPHKPGRAKRRSIIAGVVVVGLLVALVGGGYLYAQWRFGQITKLGNLPITHPVSGKPFNILEIGSDSRAGLSGGVAAQTGASTGTVSGQRSDVVKVMHVDPTAGTISILSIPRDTYVTLLANQNLYGKFNRINVNYGNGPSLLVQTVVANFGIPINHVIQVGFAGLINAADAIGGVYLYFPYPSHDPYSGLSILHPGCQLVTGFQALAVARSRHFYYNVKGVTHWPGNNYSDSALYSMGWVYDGTSDFGRIDRQNAFLRAMISRVKGLGITNPLAVNNFLSKLPQGIAIDSSFSLNELFGYALKFHSFNPAAMKTYTLPTLPAVIGGADVLIVNEPVAEQMIVNIFGSAVVPPTNPPPNAQGATPMPPHIVPTTTTTLHTTTTIKHKKKTKVPTTTTTNPTLAVPSYDPRPCAP